MLTHYLQDYSNDDLGLTLVDGGGGPEITGLRTQRAFQPWPGHAGGIVSAVRTVDPRILRFVFEGKVSTVQQRSSLIDSLADLLCTGPIEVRDIHALDRAMRGHCRVFDAVVSGSPTFVNVAPRITVEFECPSASKYDVEPLSRALGSTPVEIPCGTLAHGGQLFVAGPLLTEIRLQYRNPVGTLLSELVIVPVLATGDTLVVDLDAGQLYRRNNVGLVERVYGWKTGGTWPRCFPRDGHRALDVWGSLTLAGATGTYYWRRQWSA